MATWTLLLLAATVTAVAASSNRIIGGADTSIENYPSIVQLEFDYGGNTWGQGCGGNIISPTYVLTAAHCTYSTIPMRIRAGTTYRENGGTVINVKSFITHPDYGKFAQFDADVALLHLEEPLVYGPGIQQISIYSQGTEVADNSAVVHAGWGRTQADGSPSDILQDVTVYTVNHTECARRYEYGVTGNMICAGILDVGGKDACQLDSGGPLYFGNVLVGIVSWGIGCATSQYPGISAKVSAYTDWILANAV